MTDLTFVFDSSKINGAVSHDFTVYFPNQIDFHDRQHEAALISLNLWNTWYNVSAAWGNNQFRYFNGTVWATLVIPDGNYNLTALENAIHDGMKENGDVTPGGIGGSESYDINLIPNYNTQRLYIEVKNSFQVDLTVGNLYKLLGFDAIVVSVSQYGVRSVNITNDVNEIQLRCSLVNGGMYVNNSSSDVIYSFVPAAPPGASLNFRADNPLYMAIRHLRSFDNVRLYVTDQLGRSLSLNGEPLTATIHIRPRTLLK